MTLELHTYEPLLTSGGEVSIKSWKVDELCREDSFPQIENLRRIFIAGVFESISMKKFTQTKV